MEIHDVLIGLCALLAEILGTISGFGSSTFLVPIASHFESYHFVLAITSLLHVMSNSSRLFYFKNAVEDFKRWAYLILPSVAFTFIGAILTSRMDVDLLKLLLGIVISGVAVFNLLAKYRRFSSPTNAILICLSGFFTGLVGTGGAIRGAVLTSMQLEKHVFVFASSAIDLGGDIFRAGYYLKAGYMDWDQWIYIPIMAVAALLGAKIGAQILKKIPQRHFERLVGFLTLASGVALIIDFCK